MAYHDDLLVLARHLVDHNPGGSAEAAYRGAVSDAYYALFHLLIHEATSRVVALVAMRPRVARAFDHRDMRKVCAEYKDLPAPVPQQVRDVAAAFIELQDERHAADYDMALPVPHGRADTAVQLAEQAFADYAAVQADPAVEPFLVDLLFQSVRKR